MFLARGANIGCLGAIGLASGAGAAPNARCSFNNSISNAMRAQSQGALAEEMPAGELLQVAIFRSHLFSAPSRLSSSL